MSDSTSPSSSKYTSSLPANNGRVQLKVTTQCDPEVKSYDPKGGCATNSARYGLCVFGGRHFHLSTGMTLTPLMTVRAWCPHLALNFISSYSIRVSNQTKIYLEEESPPSLSPPPSYSVSILPPAVILTCRVNYAAL